MGRVDTDQMRDECDLAHERDSCKSLRYGARFTPCGALSANITETVLSEKTRLSWNARSRSLLR